MFLNMVKVLLASVFVKLAKMPKRVLYRNKNITKEKCEYERHRWRVYEAKNCWLSNFGRH